VIVRTEPEPFAVVEDLGGPIRFHFDERISEQISGGTLADAVSVSPRGGEVRVGHGSRTLSVEVEGGLRPGVVYRVALLPVIRDLFGNQLRDPFELVFSTGAEPTPTALAGEVWDRITGQGLANALVQAVGPDSLVYVARADAQGIFAFRYMPEGTFAVTAFDDANRDGEVGVREVQGNLPATLAVGDTLLVEVPVLPPDTAAAVLSRASLLDSVTVVLEFDDYLDPESDVSGVVVDLSRAEGGSPAVTRLFREHEYAAYVSQVRDSLSALAPPPAPPPAPDTAAAGVPTDTAAIVPPDSAAAGAPPPDTAVAGGPPPDTTGAGTPAARAPAGRGGGVGGTGPAPGGPPALPGARGAGPGGRGGQAGATPPGRVLPGRRLVALLEGPLEVLVEYQVRTSAVVNLNGLPGGGGEATLVREPPPVPEEEPAADSLAADSLAAPAPLGDSAGGPDAPPAADTLGAPPRGG